MKLPFLITFCTLYFLLTSYVNLNPDKRYYSDTDFYYEFHINSSNKKIKFKKEATYYWYKAGKIHKNYNDFDGTVLHGFYQKKKLATKELVEKGFFKYGLKHGVWKNWFVNGNLKNLELWNKGLRNGNYSSFDNNGTLLIKGNYKKGKKDGVWIDYLKKDTVTYNNGSLIIKKKKSQKSFFKSIFKKKDKNNIPKKQANKKKKKSFWKTIFKKKDKKSNPKK